MQNYFSQIHKGCKNGAMVVDFLALTIQGKFIIAIALKGSKSDGLNP